MKRIVVTILLACASCAAQNSGDARPAVSNVPGAEYPEFIRTSESNSDSRRPMRRKFKCKSAAPH